MDQNPRHAFRAASPEEAAASHTASLSVARTKSYGSAFLLPEFALEEDLEEWLEDNYAWIFEFQLAAWTDDESTWPADRDLKMFRGWFRVEHQPDERAAAFRIKHDAGENRSQLARSPLAESRPAEPGAAASVRKYSPSRSGRKKNRNVGSVKSTD